MAQQAKVIVDRRRECYRRDERTPESCQYKSMPVPDVFEVGNRGIASGVLPQTVQEPTHVFAARPFDEAYGHMEKTKLASEDGSPHNHDSLCRRVLLSRIETKPASLFQHFIEHIPTHHHLSKPERKPIGACNLVHVAALIDRGSHRIPLTSLIPTTLKGAC